MEKKVNFKELTVQMELEGEPVKLDVRKDIGNFIYQNSRDLGALELARRIYFSEGDMEMSQAETETLASLVQESKITLPLRIALLNITSNG